MVFWRKNKKIQHSQGTNHVKPSGFSLIELLVAMATFAVVVVAITEIFLIGLGGSKKIFGRQNIQESSRFIMEVMAKEMRMSKINTLPSADSYATVNITNAKAQTLDYSIDNVNKTISRAGALLNPTEVEVTGRFYVRQATADAQPRVTIILILRNKTSKESERSEINLQTTISSRNYVQ